MSEVFLGENNDYFRNVLGRGNMKTALKLLLALSLISGVAFADNPSDAPLTSADSDTAALQPHKTSDCATKRPKETDPSANKAVADAPFKHATARPGSIAPVQSSSLPTAGPKNN
jgi:hypothetical protein